MRKFIKNQAVKNQTKGISLVEMVIYVAFLGMITVFIVNFLIQILATYNRVRTEREVLSNARLIIETVSKSIEQARAVYGPTSRFNNDLGQLSLVTIVGVAPDHETAYLDYWVDNGAFVTKEDNTAISTLSAPTVRINKFRVEQIVQGLNKRGVKIIIQVNSANTNYPAAITLNSTIALRGNY